VVLQPNEHTVRLRDDGSGGGGRGGG